MASTSREGQLDGKKMKNFKCGFIPNCGGFRMRYGIWYCRSGKSNGAVLLLGGRKEFLEKYHEVAAILNSRGLDVYSMDWRGQGLSDRILGDRLKGHITDFNDYLEDLHQYLSQVVIPDSPHRSITVLAHSMGGHIALRFIHDYPSPIRRCVLASPLIDIRSNPFPKTIIRWLSGRASRKGNLEQYVPGARGGTRLHQTFSGNLITSDKQRFQREKREIVANPRLALGGVTYGWTAAALRSIDILLSPGYVKKIEVPVLLVTAGKEMIVSKTAQKRICERLPDCRLVTISDARHEILMERDDLQKIFWDAFDQFMALG